MLETREMPVQKYVVADSARQRKLKHNRYVRNKSKASEKSNYRVREHNTKQAGPENKNKHIIKTYILKWHIIQMKQEDQKGFKKNSVRAEEE